MMFLLIGVAAAVKIRGGPAELVSVSSVVATKFKGVTRSLTALSASTLTVLHTATHANDVEVSVASSVVTTIYADNGSALLLETGDYLLLESGDKLIL